jgi:hypothetical protein
VPALTPRGAWAEADAVRARVRAVAMTVLVMKELRGLVNGRVGQRRESQR